MKETMEEKIERLESENRGLNAIIDLMKVETEWFKSQYYHDGYDDGYDEGYEEGLRDGEDWL